MVWLLLAVPVVALLVLGWSYDRGRRKSGSSTSGFSPDEYGTRVYGSMITGKDVKHHRP
jgi:hypothetical protein